MIGMIAHNIMTLILTTFSIAAHIITLLSGRLMILSKTTNSISTLSTMTLSTMRLTLMALSIPTHTKTMLTKDHSEKIHSVK
jgi:hypothetical protein